MPQRRRPATPVKFINRKKIIMKRILTLCGLFATLTVLFFSCQKDVSSKGENAEILGTLVPANVLSEACGTPVVKDLMDHWGRGSWGNIVITNDADNIIIQVNSTLPGMYLGQVTLSFGSEDSVVADLLREYFWDPCEGPATFDAQKKYTPLTVTSDTIRIPNSAFLEDGCIWLSVNVDLDGDHGTIGCAFASPSDKQYASGLWHSAFKYCQQECPPTDCGPGRTQTPGGWGAEPNGNNNGAYLHKNFAAAFPTGLQVGCYPSNYYINLTSAQAITDLLPTGGEAKALTQNYTDPSSIKNVLVGHLVALTLSVGFDAKYEDFGQGGIDLDDMIIGSGAFNGWTVGAFLAEANKVLGGCSSAYTAKQVLETATAINENYVDGKVDKGYLTCSGDRL
jgi:hypothetical protein